MNVSNNALYVWALEGKKFHKKCNYHRPRGRGNARKNHNMSIHMHIHNKQTDQYPLPKGLSYKNTPISKTKRKKPNKAWTQCQTAEPLL